MITKILVGCYPEKLKYNLGIGTNSIHGSFNGENGNSLNSKAFIVIIEYYSSFVKFENESPIYVPKARLVFPNKKGGFKINFDLKAVSIDLTFIASGYKTQHFYFRRQIGVGDLQYDVDLIKSDTWESEFIIQTRPFLEKFILEQRYKMPDSQQMYIGNWIAKEKNKLLKKNKNY